MAGERDLLILVGVRLLGYFLGFRIDAELRYRWAVNPFDDEKSEQDDKKENK